VSDSSARANQGHGFSIGAHTTVRDCAADANQGDGINCFASDVQVRGCLCTRNTQDGLEVVAASLVIGNISNHNGFNAADGAGIHVVATQNTIDGNTVVSNDRGIDIDQPGNLVIRNRAAGNPSPFDLVPGNAAGPTVNSATILTSTSPHANYAY
jgi:parallel beta-helix repeat protein